MVEQSESLTEVLKRLKAENEANTAKVREGLEAMTQRLAGLEAEGRRIAAALQSAEANREEASAPSGRMTIKEGVLHVLRNVPAPGLSAQAILDRLAADLDMHYERTSLSPQLSRLKQEGKIALSRGLWSLVRL